MLQIIMLKSMFKGGLNSGLLAYIGNIELPTLPLFVPGIGLLNKDWLAGFVSADGSFGVNPTKAGNVLVRFSISQHVRDLPLLLRIQSLIGGHINKAYKDNFELRIGAVGDILESVLPIFNLHPLHGTKALDFLDFSRCVMIMKDKGHQTKEGMNNLMSIASGMNSKRPRDIDKSK